MNILKKLAKLLFWLTGLAVIAAAAAVILVTTVDPNEHTDWIEARIAEETGRRISLDGPIAFTLYPWLGLEAKQVSIANAEGFGAEPLAYLDYVKLRVKTLPLLREEYEVDTIAVKGAVLNLARDEHGIANWDDLDGVDDSGEAKKDKAMLPLAAVALGGVAIEDARITLDDQQAAVRHEISALDVSIAELKYGEPVDINLSFRANSNKPALESTVALAGIITYATDEQQFAVDPLDINADIKGGNIPGGRTSVRLSATLDVNMDEETAAFSDFTLSALGATVRGNLSAQQIESPTPAISATLDVQGSDLGLLFKVAEIEPLASQLARLADRNFQVSVTVDADLERGDVDLSGLSVNLLGAIINGKVKVRNLHSDTPGYQGELNARGPDLPTLMQVLGQLQRGQDAALSDYGKRLADIPAKAFRVATVFDADLDSGDVSIPALSLEALGISATGALDARDMNSKKGTVEGNLSVEGNRVAGLLTALDQAGLAEVLQSVKLDTRVQGIGTGIALETMSLQAVFAGEDIPGSPATMTLNADTRLNLDKETLVLEEVTLDGLGLKTAGRVEFKHIFDEPAASGRLVVQPVNLRRLARQLRQELPVTTDEDTFTRVSLAGRLDRSATDLGVEQLELQVDDTRLTGEFRVGGGTSRPLAQFDLNVDQIDLDRYLPADSQARQTGGGLAALPIVATTTDMDGELSIDRLIVADARLDGFRLRMKARNGVVHINPVTAALYEGRLSADMNLDMNATAPALTLNADITDIQVEPLLVDMKGKARLRGKGDFNAALVAEGTSIAAMKRSLNGRMSMSLTEGAVTGFNLGRTLRQWKRFKKGGTIDFKETAATDFSLLSGNPIAKNGVIRMDDLDLKAPAFRLKGKGVLADLHTDTINYQALAAVVNTSKGDGGKELGELAGLELPININGPLDNPKIRLAWQDILGSVLTEKILDFIDLSLPGKDNPDKEKESDAGPDVDPVKELLKEGLKGLFKR